MAAIRCPACGFDNIEGDDECANCGASLRSADDLPDRGRSFLDRVIGMNLGALGPAAPATIDPGAPVTEAIARMHALETDCLLVVRDGRVVGIFTDRDAVLKAAGVPIQAFDVRDMMTPDPVVVRPDDSLAIAVHKMAVGEFRHLPVVGDDGPVGIVAAKDVFRHLLSLAD